MHETKQCQKCQSDFIIEDEDFEFYKKMKVPAPTWCPDCRAKRRMNFYNIKTLYKRSCDKCNQGTLSIYDKDAEFPIYCPKCWWADDWDAKEYAVDYNFDKSFLTQFQELYKKVPRIALETDYLKMINSPYVNACGALKNCYLVFLGARSESTMYSYSVDKVKNSLDCTNISSVENSYDLFNCKKTYNTVSSSDCEECLNIYFSKKLKNCSNCFGCVNLKNKSYYIFNKEYSKKEYFEKIKEFKLGSFESKKIFKKETQELFLQFPNKYFHGIKNVNISGDYIFNSKNVINSYEVLDGENIKFCHFFFRPGIKDCYDYTNWGDNASRIYETCHSGESINNIKFTNGAWHSFDIEYSDNPLFSSNLFGCVFLNKKQYCILNKQYTKEEYFPMVEKIKKHMDEMPYTDKQGNEYKYGEFFPPELSPFAYNETIAQEYFPLTREEAKKQGYRWKNPEKKDYQATIEAKDLPDNIKDVDDSILKEVIGCNTKPEDREQTGCTTAFKVIPKELEFYKKLNIPLPRYCPNCRHHERLKNRNPLKLYKRTCQKEGCSTEFETTYAPDRKEIVYCEKCYNNEVV